MKRDIEKRLVEEISPLAELLGTKRTDDLKDRICELIVTRVDADLADYQDYLISPDGIQEIIEEALEEVHNKIKKKFKDKYLEIAEKALQNLSAEKGGEG